MKITSAYYLIGATNTDNFPNLDHPEFLLCGRSNVGKSTFINTLFDNKSLAKTSSSPGKTQVLNWFIINEKFSIVDAPGYGYAKVSKKQREEFGEMIEDYLTNRKQLKMVFLLVDYRHKPSDDDVVMYEFLNHYNIPVVFILTKEDKVKRNDCQKNMNVIMKSFNCFDKEKYVEFSSINKVNIDRVLSMFQNNI